MQNESNERRRLICSIKTELNDKDDSTHTRAMIPNNNCRIRQNSEDLDSNQEWIWMTPFFSISYQFIIDCMVHAFVTNLNLSACLTWLIKPEEE